MRPSRIHEVLGRLLEARWPCFLWGPPGAGKSSIVRQVATERKMKLLDIRAPLLDPTDLRGIPVVEEGVARWCPPSFLPTEECDGVLFFDELNAAPPLVQASLYQLTLDRRVGEYVLPDGWRIVAAGNREQDGAVTFRMPSALANRFIHLDFEVDFEDWRIWALGVEIHPLILGFLATSRENLFTYDRTSRAFPTPRSWEMASDVLKVVGSVREAEDLLLGVVGEGATLAFLGYSEKAITEEKILGILARPSTEPLPESLGDLYALANYIAATAMRPRVRRAAAKLLGRLQPELAVLVVRDVTRQDAKFVMEPKVQAFLAEHQAALL